MSKLNERASERAHALGWVLLGLLAVLLIAAALSGVLLTTTVPAGASQAAPAPSWSVDGVLFWIIVFDAIAILIFGIVCAIAVLSGVKADTFWERAPPAMLILVGSSLGGAALLWGAGYLFGGAL